MKSLLRGFAPALIALVTYAVRIRPWLLTWGATRGEVAGPWPGDDIVPQPRCTSTRAITICADPQDVWPWLAQLGQGRGGLYSYERLENLFGCDIHNLDRVAPELQGIKVGDHIRLVPEDFKVDLVFEVAIALPNQALVLKGHGAAEEAIAQGFAYPSWAFVIEGIQPGSTRLIARWRSNFAPTPSGYLWWKYAIEPVHFAMERKMLKGIKQRAEALSAAESGSSQGAL